MASKIRYEELKSDPGSWMHAVDRVHDDRLSAFRTRVDTDYSRSLSTLIESEIIPRLMVAHASDTLVIASHRDLNQIDYSQVEEFAPLALQVDADALLKYIEGVLAGGVSVDTVMVDLLAPAARLLGEYWEEDLCDFVDVTLGLWRLQEIVQQISPSGPSHGFGGDGHRALFATMPGDQHNFGTVVIDEVFRNGGWVTERISEAETPDLLKSVANNWFDLVGLTVSCDSHIAQTASIITAVRNVSRNPRVCVMVGGRLFSLNPNLAMQVGADGTARDAKIALKMATSLVTDREQEAAVRC